MRPGVEKSHLTAVVLALFVVMLWATSWVLIKIGLGEIPALTFAGLRYMLAFICLAPIAVWTQRRRPFRPIPRRVVGRLIVLGVLLYALTQGAIFLALEHLPAVMVNLLWSSSTIVIALLGTVWLAERLTRVQWIGVLVAALGAVVYFVPLDLPAGYLVGVAVSIVGVLSNAGAVILGRGINRSLETPPLVVTTISMGVGATLLLAVGLISQGMPIISAKGWAIIAWLAVVNTALAFTLWNTTLRVLSAAESSIINGTMLIWIPILAVLFLNEQVSGKEILGLILAGVGTLMVQVRMPRPFRRHPRTPPA